MDIKKMISDCLHDNLERMHREPEDNVKRWGAKEKPYRWWNGLSVSC